METKRPKCECLVCVLLRSHAEKESETISAFWELEDGIVSPCENRLIRLTLQCHVDKSILGCMVAIEGG